MWLQLDINLTDDNIKLLAQLFNTYCYLPNVEIEGKLGFLINSNNDGTVQRYILPGIRTIVPLDKDSISYKKPIFNSSVDHNMFIHLNDKILYGKYNVEKYYHINNIQHKRTHTIDVIYELNGKPYRVTRPYTNESDQLSPHSSNHNSNSSSHRTSEIQIIEKIDLDNIDYFNPLQGTCDFRISAKEEHIISNMDVVNDKNSRIRLCRVKDRTSYLFDIWSIDCTKVTTYKSTQLNERGEIKPQYINSGTITYEVEMECINNSYVRYHAQLHRDKKPNQMINIAQSLYNNIRTIAMFAFPTVNVPATCIVPPHNTNTTTQQHAGIKRNAPTNTNNSNNNDEEKKQAI